MKNLNTIGKRIIAVILALIMVIGVAGCGKEDKTGYSERTEDIDDEQRAAVNMLNYLSLINEEISASNGNQLVLEDIYSSLINNTNTDYIDGTTQGQINNLLDTIHEYRMIDVKRARLERIYEQNKTKALLSAVPDLSSLVSEEGDTILDTIVSSVGVTMPSTLVLNSTNMVMGAAADYFTARNEAETEFIESGWALDDEEMTALHESTKNAFNYMLDITKGYKISDAYILKQEDIQSFVEWRNQSSENNTGKLEWFMANQKTYENFGPYWLELAKVNYFSKNYQGCLDCMQAYKNLNVNIFRKDKDYGRTLAVAINSAQEILDDDHYIEYAKKCCDEIMSNSNDEDADLRYYVAMTYVGLFEKTKDQQYLSTAYDITKNNVNTLAKQQRELNEEYLGDVKEMDTPNDASKRQKKEIKQINKLLKEERKIALPPVLEDLTLNCDLLKVLSKKLGKDGEELNKLDSMLHTDSKKVIFLTEDIDERYWFTEHNDEGADIAEDKFEKKTLTIPVICLSENCEVKVVVTGESGTTVLDDWIIEEVKRPKNSDMSDFTATFSSKTSNDYKYQAGDKISVLITPLKGYLDEKEFEYEAVASKIPFVVDIVKVGE